MKQQQKAVQKITALAVVFFVFCSLFFVQNANFVVMAQENIITIEQAKQKVEKRFEMYDIEKIEYLGVGGDALPTYNFKLNFKDKDEFCVQVTQEGGYILTIGCVAQNISNLLIEQQCLKAVEDFVHKIGFTNLRAIWSTKLGDETVVNLAPVIKDVIIYPDLLKVRINCKNGDILGMEARTYLYDFYLDTADILNPILSFDEVRQTVPSEYEIVGHRLALIFEEENRKSLTYEIETKLKDTTYYFYINANNGKIEQVFPVI
jgi:spore germination protein